MKAINFMPGQTVILAKNQSQYFELPVINMLYSDGTSAFISAWVCNWWERIKILFGMPVYLMLLTADPHAPVLLTTSKVEIGIHKIEDVHKEV